ncbi:hypothetical protein PENSPDRAFT_650862 [Peniophora sp. CONT]|nr:hypothetical protein PENSPDRAFT_650862 [Peniophora sp. CONT]
MDSLFPSLIPLESSVDPDFELSMDDFPDLLRADDLYKAAIGTSSGVDAVTSALAHLHGALSWLDRVSRTLRHRSRRLSARKNGIRNRGLPISRLPVEIFRIIFEYDAESSGSWSFVDEPLSWRRLGSVCRQWRFILFDAPNIWADDLFGLGIDKVSEVLPLTKNAPLNIDLPYCPPLDLIDDLYQMLPRAWRFSTEIELKDDLHNVVNALSSQHFPHLQTLVLHCDCNGWRQKQKLGIKYISNCPNLRHITLRNFYLQPQKRSGLTHFQIEFEDEGDDPRESATRKPTMDMIVEALSSNPTLQNVHLYNSFTGSHRRTPALQRVLLPFLTSLTLYHSGALSADLLEHLWLPALTTVDITWPYRPRSQNDEEDSGIRVYKGLLGTWTPLHSRAIEGSLTMHVTRAAMKDLRARSVQFALALQEINDRTEGGYQIRDMSVVPDRPGAGKCVFRREARTRA